MSELRLDPLARQWVVIAPGRSARPSDFRAARPRTEDVSDAKTCAFCPGNEDQTPPAISVRSNGDGRWSSRVVPNRYPALVDDSPDVAGAAPREAMAARGRHEVVIETARHDCDLSDLPTSAIADVLATWRERARALEAWPGARSVLLFRNRGAMSGASIAHPHSQILAAPIVPRPLEVEADSCRRYFSANGSCLLCDLIARESDRMVGENATALAVVPWAARFPFEVLVIPRQHRSRFSGIADSELMPLADLLGATIRRLRERLGDPSYNLLIHQAPAGDDLEAAFHWHAEIVPRLHPAAALDWSIGLPMNPMRPEDSARELRAIEVAA